MGILQNLGNLIGGTTAGADTSALGLAHTSMGLGTLATGIDATGALLQGMGASSESRYQATLHDAAASSALLAGQQSETALKMQYGARVGEQVASTASRGVGVTGGSAANIVQSTRALEGMDAAIMHYNTAREAYGYEATAGLERKAAGNMLLRGITGAESSIIGGAYGLSSKWLQYKGAFGDSNPMTLSSPVAAKLSSARGPDYEQQTPIDAGTTPLTAGIPNG